ncbi:probable G-protein coupled receptor 139 [Leucoraja erinacea]|uniref:probable G-protein coupled receptor 139 n=1 Tax=Leucoraja erinaceus TaxID=7782 RepID=UPI0024559407|nr:probable G-protein coupled receptor 139 [Leucoraja erinacea]
MHEPPKGAVYAIYYPVLAAVGVPVNIIAMVILSRGRCGLSKCITLYLVAMAASDLMVLITAVILQRIVGIYFPGSYLSLTWACRFKSPIAYACRDSSVWLTVAFTFDRFVAICCRNFQRKYCTKETAAPVVAAIVVLSFFKNFSFFFLFEPLYIADNLAWYCRLIPSFYTSPWWRAYSYFNHITTPLVPFALILLLNVLTVKHIVAAGRVRKSLRDNSLPGKGPDPEMENRKKSIVLLFSISGNVILLWMTYIIHYLYSRMTETYKYSGYNDPVFILAEAGNMLLLLSCCTNTFIYTVTQSKFRDQLKTMLTYPFTQFAKLT